MVSIDLTYSSNFEKKNFPNGPERKGMGRDGEEGGRGGREGREAVRCKIKGRDPPIVPARKIKGRDTRTWKPIWMRQEAELCVYKADDARRWQLDAVQRKNGYRHELS